MDVEREVKQERSVPVQSRVDLVSLARLDMYWKAEGYEIRTMSQLVSWSVDLVREIIEKNGMMPEGIDSLRGAHAYLVGRGLYRREMKRRGREKVATGLRMESIRGQGQDPRMHSEGLARQHQMLHRSNAVEPFIGEVEVGKDEKYISPNGIDWDEVDRKVAGDKERELEESIARDVENAKQSGMIVSEAEIERRNKIAEEGGDLIPERDKEVIAKENAPFNKNDFKLVDE